MSEPWIREVESTLAAWVTFKGGAVFPGCVRMVFHADQPLEIACTVWAFPPPDDEGRYLECDLVLVRDLVVRAAMLPGLKCYGSGAHRIKREADDKIRLFLQADPSGDDISDFAPEGARAICLLARQDVEDFVRVTMDLVGVGSDEELGTVRAELDAVLEEWLSG